MNFHTSHLTRAFIHLDHLTHNMRLLQSLVGDSTVLWPAIKANGYGHGAEIIARHLVRLGYRTLCVAHVDEAIDLAEAGIDAGFIILSATLPENSDDIVAHDCEVVVCDLDMVAGLARAAARRKKKVLLHLKVDTGMGRIGIRPDQVTAFLEACRQYPGVRVKGVMSHFPLADEADKTFSHQQIECFREVVRQTRPYDIDVYHFANSAAIFDLPGASFDASRPGISIYGLKPSAVISNPDVQALRPVLEWKTRITFLKEVPANAGISYGHTFRAGRPSLIATVPLGYGDGISRLLSNRMDLLIGGRRCPQVGRICMDQSMVDVTALQGSVQVGDEAVIIGRQGTEEITADELAEKLGTINYEIVTHIAERIPRIEVGNDA